MATEAQLLDAMRRAHEAGDTEAATRFAGMIKAQRGQQPTRAERPAGTPRKERSWGDYAQMGLRALGDVAGEAGDMFVDNSPVGVLKNATTMLAAPLARRIAPKAAPVINQVLAPNLNFKQRAADLSNAANLAAPRTRGERIASEAFKGAITSIVPGGGGSRAARLARKAAEAAFGAGAGGTSQYVAEEGGSPLAQTAAGLAVGGLAPTALNSVRHLGSNLLEHTNLSGVRGREAQAGKRLREAAEATGNPNAVNEAVSASLIRNNPVEGVQPTVAETFRNEGLAAMQRREGGNPAAIKVGENAQARAAAADRAFGAGDPNAVRDLSIERGLATEAAQRQATEALTGGPVPPDRFTSGDVAMGEMKGGYETAIEATRAAYQVPVLQTRHQLSATPRDYRAIRNPIRDFRRDAGGPVPGEIMAVVNDVRAAILKKDFNSATITNADQRLREIAGTLKQAGERRAARLANQLSEGLTARFADRLPAEYDAAIKNARAVRRQQGQVFEEDRVGALVRDKRYGSQATANAEVPAKLVRPGAAGRSTADELVAAIGPQASERVAREELHRLVDEGGIAKVTGANYRELINRFPALRSDIDRLAETASLAQHFGKSQLGKIGSNNAQEHINSIIAKPNSNDFGELLHDVMASGDDRAVSGLRRSMAEYINADAAKGADWDKADQMIPTNTINAIENVLKRTENSTVLTKEQRDVLRGIQTEMKSAEFAGKSGVHADDSTPIPLPVVGKVRATLRAALAAASNQGQVDQLLREVFLDPNKARVLMLRKPDRMKRWLRQMGRSTAQALVASSNTTPVPQED